MYRFACTYLWVQLIYLANGRFNIASKDMFSDQYALVNTLSINLGLGSAFLGEGECTVLVALVHEEIHDEVVHELRVWYDLIESALPKLHRHPHFTIFVLLCLICCIITRSDLN